MGRLGVVQVHSCYDGNVVVRGQLLEVHFFLLHYVCSVFKFRSPGFHDKCPYPTNQITFFQQLSLSKI